MTIVPDPAFRVSCTQVGPDGRFTQFYSTEITPAIYEKEIAPARTFVFYEDVKPLMDKGLIKGGSLENAVVVRGESVLSKEPLRFREEFARHKILDIVGDLSLFGRADQGPRHRRQTRPRTEHRSRARGGETVRENDGARAAERDAEGRRRARRERRDEAAAASLSVPDGRSHRRSRRRDEMHRREVGDDERTLFPGPLSRATRSCPACCSSRRWRRSAASCFCACPAMAGKIGYFMSADAVKFRKPVVPGDTLFIEVEMMQRKKSIVKAAGAAS